MEGWLGKSIFIEHLYLKSTVLSNLHRIDEN